MLACTALVGCSDDDVLDNNGGKEQQEVKYGDAYLSLAISSNTNSSRSGGVNPGDEDGTADDSGHYNAGTTQESAIEKVLVVLSQGTTSSDDTKPNGIVELFSTPTTDFTETSGVYKLNKVYRMGVIGDYKVMVVVNPVESLLGVIDNNDHAKTYENIYNHEATAASYVSKTDNKTYFMMSNKNAVSITVTEANNSENNPAGLTDADDIVNVERTTSKITYRWKDAITNQGDAIKNLGNNVYKIDVTGQAYKSVTAYYWFEDVASDATDTSAENWKYARFKKAKIGETEYWVLFKDGTTNGLVLNGDQFNSDNIYGVYTATTGRKKVTSV